MDIYIIYLVDEYFSISSGYTYIYTFIYNKVLGGYI